MLSLALSTASLLSFAAAYRTSPTNRFIYDDAGRVSFFHGENFVQKGYPWYPEELLNVDHIKEMKSWGWNTVRLGVMWSGVETEPNVFNETYINVIGGIIDDLEANGIHAILDMHQDVLSSYFCEYDGAPKHVIDLSNSSEHEFPWPLEWDETTGNKCDRPWGANYLAEATGAAFQDLYDNVNGMRDHLASFWRKVAKSFKSKAILGYEIINEPWPGNIYKKPSLLLPGVAGKESLQPLYDVISDAIREEDTEHLIFYEPVTWGMIFNGTVTGSGFTHVPGGEQFADKSVFSFHYYCWWFNDDTSEMQKVTCDRMFGPKIFDQVVEDVAVLGGSAMLTEWGQGCNPWVNETAECSPIMDMADAALVGWTDWYWTGSLMDGWRTDPLSIATFSRTYAHAVAGTPTKMKFSAETLRFELCYDVDPAVTEPTVIYVNNAVHYQSGVNVRVSGGAAPYMQVTVGEGEANSVLLSYSNTGAVAADAALDCCVVISAK